MTVAPDYVYLLERLEADRLPECSFDDGRTWETDDVVVAETFTACAVAIRNLVAEREGLEANLNGRDDFIVAQGLWSNFVDQLPALSGRGKA